VTTVTLGGGVAANAGLRAAMRATGLRVHLPAPRRCTDNAAMIANAGRLHLLAGASHSLDFTARAAWPIH
jgi:N6-L-threonylcarbamoyladenine synthase